MPQFSSIDNEVQQQRTQAATVQQVNGKDSTVIGINKGYTTANTAFTSNPENYSVTQVNMNGSIAPAKNMFGTSQTEILNYPYAYD